MVADALVYHPTVAHYLKFVSTTIGRDKFLRTLQYFSRFYAWYLLRMNGSPSEIAPYEAMKKSFGMIRKGMRLGKFVEHFKAAAMAYDTPSPSDRFLRFCAVGRQIGYAGYLTMDNLSFLHAAGIKKFDAKTGQKLQDYAYKAWFVGLSFNAVAGLYQLLDLSQRTAAVDKKDGESAVESKKLERERSGVTRQLVSDLCDITVPSFALGYAPFLDDGIVGIAGTVSSIIGLQGAWRKTA